MAEYKNIEELSFKEASIELERIIQNLERGDMELEESLEGYARGVELLKSLRERLASAEQKVSVLMKDIDGTDILVPGEPASADDKQLDLKGASMSDCIFCKIAAHEIPSTVVYEDDLVIAFDDLNPQAPVHTLVIPKAHHENIIDGVPAATLAAMTHAVAEVARIKGLDEGFRVISNKGEAAGQTVMHFHLHVLGGKPLGEGLI